MTEIKVRRSNKAVQITVNKDTIESNFVLIGTLVSEIQNRMELTQLVPENEHDLFKCFQEFLSDLDGELNKIDEIFASQPADRKLTWFEKNDKCATVMESENGKKMIN